MRRFQAWQGQVFVHRQGHHIARSAAIEIAGAGMVDGMIAPPAIVGGKSEQAGENPDCIVRFTDLKNEPCPQSWKMMKVRTRKPAASTESARVNR